jgi:hypothetical protein
METNNERLRHAGISVVQHKKRAAITAKSKTLERLQVLSQGRTIPSQWKDC